MTRSNYFFAIVFAFFLSMTNACPKDNSIVFNMPVTCKNTRLSSLNKTWRIEGDTLSFIDIIAKLPPLNTLKTLEIFSSDTILLDGDLRLPGVDLVIIAPTWKINSPITINLSGSDGVLGGSDGVNGLSGGHGQNGGHFIGKVTKVIQEGELNIKVNGGNGGKGGDGKNGRYGFCGDDGVEALVLERDESTMRSRTKLSFEDGKIEWILESMATYNDRFRTEYTSGNPGEDGENSGMAGRGGDGGYAGKVKIITRGGAKLSKNVEDNNGIKGEDGRFGKPGKGGRGARVYSGVYLEAIACPSLRGYSESTGGLGGAATASAVGIGQAAITMAVQNAAAQHFVYQVAAETVKQGVAQVMKGGTAGLTKEAAQKIGKEIVRGLLKKVGPETLKRAGGSFIQGPVASLIAGTTGGTLQNLVGQTALRGMGRAASSELGKVAATAGVGAFKWASTAGSLGISLIVQSGLSILHETFRNGWEIPVKELERRDGKAGQVLTEFNDFIFEQTPKEKENLNNFLEMYLDYLLD